MSVDNATTGSLGGHEIVKNSSSDIEMRKDKINESDNRNIDIIFSQNLIVQHATKASTLVTAENSGITNFKRFRKVLLFAFECLFLHHSILNGVQITASCWWDSAISSYYVVRSLPMRVNQPLLLPQICLAMKTFLCRSAYGEKYYGRWHTSLMSFQHFCRHKLTLGIALAILSHLISILTSKCFSCFLSFFPPLKCFKMSLDLLPFCGFFWSSLIILDKVPFSLMESSNIFYDFVGIMVMGGRKLLSPWKKKEGGRKQKL